MDLAPGRSLNRDLVSGRSEQAAIDEINRFVSRQHAKRVKDEGDEATEAAWRAAERREEARRQREWHAGRLAVCEHLVDVYTKLASEHAAEARKLRTRQPEGAA